MRLATIDVGTNTVQLLVADTDGTTIHRQHTAERFVRLGEGVDARGYIGADAQDRLLSALQTHLDTATSYSADHVTAVATSAMRDAENQTAVLRRIFNELNLSVDVLSGQKEAAWSFAAACSGIRTLTGPCLVVDIGGGSTELVAGINPAAHHPNYPRAIIDRVSLDVGCVRLTERCFDTHPPTPAAIGTVEGMIERGLAAGSLELGPSPTLVATAGTATALALVHAGPDSTLDALHASDYVLSRADIRHWRDRLLERTVDEIFALHPEAMAGRADIFPVGVLLLACILDHYGCEELQISPYHLRHGLALRVLAGAN